MICKHCGQEKQKRKRGRLDDADRALIEALLCERKRLQEQIIGLSDAAIAEKFGVSYSTITQAGRALRRASGG